MKKILFVCNNLDHGGISRSLVSLLREIHRDYAVDLLLFHPWGPYLKDVPEDVRLLPSEGLLPLLGMTKAQARQQSKRLALLRAFFSLFSRIFGSSLPQRWIFSRVPDLAGYDAAVAFTQALGGRNFAVGCNSFVIQKVQAGRKISFVHWDFEHYRGNTRANRRLYRKFDRVACVSRGCRTAFLRVMPELEARTKIVYNCTDYVAIRRMGQEPVEVFSPDCVNLLSVSRITQEKAYPRAVSVMKRMMPDYPALRWYVVGDGPELPELERSVQEAGLSDRIILLGAQDNPYCYMQRADALFLPSLYEAAPVVFDEAKALGLPVLTTETTSSAKLIGVTGCGLVCENSERGIEEALRKVLEEPALLGQFRDKIRQQSFDNQLPREQWERLIRG